MAGLGRRPLLVQTPAADPRPGPGRARGGPLNRLARADAAQAVRIRRRPLHGACAARDPAPQDVGEVGVAHRLGDVVVHAGVEASLAVAVHRMGGHRDHRRAAALLAAAQLAGRLVAVHVGHLAVHQDRVVAPRGERLERLAPVADDVDAAAAALERASGDDLVDGAVLGDQHERRRSTRGGSPNAVLGGGRRRVRRLGAAERQLEPERAAAPGFALGADRPAHQLDELAGDREAQSGAAVVRVVETSACVNGSNMRCRLAGIDPDAAVGDLGR